MLLLKLCDDVIVLQMRGQGVSVKDVNQHEFVKAFAAFLKKCVITNIFIVRIEQLRNDWSLLLA